MDAIELYNDHFQNYKVYGIPKAQLIIADPPYNLGKNAYASNPMWYEGGDNTNGGKRNAREAAHFKAEGVVSGVPDLFLAAGRHGFNGMFIEMKAGRNGESVNQKEVRKMLEDSGYYCTVCRSLDEFMSEVEHYLTSL